MKNIFTLSLALVITLLFPADVWSGNFTECMFNETENVSESSSIFYESPAVNNNAMPSMADAEFTPHDVTVYLKDPGWSEVYLYSWDANGELLGNWPGTMMTDTKEIDGVKWYYKTFTVAEENYNFNIIFNQGMGQGQTKDISGIDSDRYYEIGEMVDGSFTYKDVTPGKSDFVPYDVTVYLKDPGWSEVYLYSWDANGELLGNWPGTMMTDTKEIDGVKWYYKTFTVAEENYKFDIIFNQGMGQGQTKNIIGIDSDRYYEIGEMVDGSFTCKDVTPGKSDFEPYDITVYLKDPGWSETCFYAWDANGELLGTWPGKNIADTKMIDGCKWYYCTFSITAEDYFVNVIFNSGSGNTQTVDITNINADKFYELGEMENGKYLYKDISFAVGIDNVITTESDASTKVYSLSGQMLRQYDGYVAEDIAVEGLPEGVYVINGKKYIKR